MIVKVNTDGTGRTCIVNGAPTSFSFSPDGRKIAYVLTDKTCPESGTCDETDYLFIANANGTDPDLLASGWIIDPVWAPDAGRIIFRTSKRVKYTTNAVTLHLNMANSDGNNLKELFPTWFGPYSWSPDGQTIAFSCTDGENVEVCMANGDGSRPVFVTNTPALDAFTEWSPDGEKILFYSDRDTKTFSYYSMDANGENPVRLITKFDGIADGHWSPDGRKIVYVYYYHTDIFTVSPDGSDDRQLTNHIASDQCPIWSFDSKKIIFITKRNGPREIFIMNEDGSDQKPLVWMGGEYDYCPVWVPGQP